MMSNTKSLYRIEINLIYIIKELYASTMTNTDRMAVTKEFKWNFKKVNVKEINRTVIRLKPRA